MASAFTLYDIVRRALSAPPELVAELRRRGLFLADEAAQLRENLPKEKRQNSEPLGPVQFATLLAKGDTQLASCAVLRGIVTREELEWLNRLLKLEGPYKKREQREELTRTVERAIEGRESANGRIRHAGIRRTRAHQLRGQEPFGSGYTRVGKALDRHVHSANRCGQEHGR